MSTDLGFIDTTGVLVGQVYTFDWSKSVILPTLSQQAGYTVSDHLVFMNESPAELRVTLNPTGRSFTLPSGGWTPNGVPVSWRMTQDTSATFLVEAVLANPLVRQIHIDYYAPGEPITAVSTLGNSPIGGSVTVTSSPVIVLDPISPTLGITVTTPVTVATYTTAAPGLYMITGSFLVNNGGASSVTIQAQFTSDYNGAVNTRTLANNTGGTLSAAGLSNGTYGIACPTFFCQGGTNITVTYQNALNTPNDDAVFGVIQVFS